MGFAFNLSAVLISILLPPLILGFACGALGRRWAAFRWLGAVAIACFLVWAVQEFLWPWGGMPEARPYRWHILLAIAGSAALGLSALGWVSRMRGSRSAI